MTAQPHARIEDSTATPPDTYPNRPSALPGPLGWIVRLFSSVWLGITLLFLLFVYCSIGSAGIPTHWNLLDPLTWENGRIREWRGLELTEFEWFHWWPFNLLIGLICTNLVVATLRRIPFKPVNYGVWMIHTGIITLAVGSVIYFGTKVEGDAPVTRRQIVIEVPGARPVTIPVLPGAQAIVGSGANSYLVQVERTLRDWELRTEGLEGQRANVVNVLVSTPATQFRRRLIEEHPELTEDQTATGERAIKAIGRKLVDENITLLLKHKPQEYFHLMNSDALYVRQAGQVEWVQRPIDDLPRYNNYIGDRQSVWLDGLPADEIPPERPLNTEVAADPDANPSIPTPDALGGPVRVTGYLRYAMMEQRREAGDQLDPFVRLHLTGPGGHPIEAYELIALDPELSFVPVRKDGRDYEAVRFRWIENESQFEPLIADRQAALEITVPETGETFTTEIDSLAAIDETAPFIAISGTDFSYRVKDFQNNLRITESLIVSVAVLELRSPQRTIERWVFQQPQLNRDLIRSDDDSAHASVIPRDERVQMRYLPGNAPPPVTLIGGPEENQLRAAVATTEKNFVTDVKLGEPIPFTEPTWLVVQDFSARSRMVARPRPVPKMMQDRQATNQFSMIQVQIPLGDGQMESVWLPFHNYSYNRPNDALEFGSYRPTAVQLADGREIELMYSRQRRLLPAPVVLDEFITTEEVGGYSSSNLEVRNWTSVVSFQQPGGSWSPLRSLSLNDPIEHGGFWFFQSYWDAPSQGRNSVNGQNWTGLGVGNRNGVHTQLAGCCIAVLGMIYAFYIKPIIKRRRQQRVYDEVAAGRTTRDGLSRAATPPAPVPVGALRENLT